MIALWRRWVEAATAKEHGTTLALFRIFVGVLLVVDTAHVLLVGALDPLYRPTAEGGLAPAAHPHVLVEVLGGASIELVYALTWTSLSLAVLLALGVAGRVPALVILQIRLALHSIPIDIGGGYDRLLDNALWLLVLGSSTATLSVWCRLRTGRWTSDVRVHAFPRHFAVLQLVVLYTFTGLIKGGAGWEAPHEAIYRLMHITAYSRWDLTWTAVGYPAFQLATVCTVLWEITFWVAGLAYAAREGWLGGRLQQLSHRFDLRIPHVVVGVLFHIGLFVLVDVGPFSPATLAFYVAFASPQEWRALPSAVRSVLDSRRRRAPD